MYNSNMHFLAYSRFIVGSSFIAAYTMATAQSLTLVIDSDPQDPIGFGQHRTLIYTPSTPGGLSREFFYYFATGLPGAVQFVMGDSTSPDGNTLASFRLSTDQLGHELQAGAYTDAERSGFESPGHPGLDFSFQNRGSNTLTGTFTINSIHWKSEGGIQVLNDLDVVFEQHTEGLPPACRGRVTYFNDPVPEPITMVALGIGLIGFIRRKKR
jgi:PEP-CTERM motif